MFYDDIVHEFGEITRNNGYYAAQAHSRSPIFVLIERPYATSYCGLIVTYVLSCTVSEIAFDRSKFAIFGYPLAFNPPAGGYTTSYHRKWYIAKN